MLDILQSIVPTVLFYSAPLILTALGGVFSERSGVVNIGLEGLMVMGAFVGIVFNLTFADVFGTSTPWVSIVVAMLIGGLFSIIHAVASVTFHANQVVSGVAINMLALGVGVYLTKVWYDKGQTDMVSQPFYTTDIPLLEKIPVIGPIFFQGVYVTSYLAIILAFVAWYVLYKTPFGLRLRAVGEHPMAADTNGIKVERMRYIAVILSGVLGGLGGSVFALTIASNFSSSTIVGQGFMALAAVIFGKWHPLGAMGAALFFGLAQSLTVVSSGVPFLENVPQVLLLIAPYVLTILALAGFIGRADAPRANGVPYIKGSR
ncbi:MULTISPECIES: ABC transporter permease [Oceanobacillus]|uniref:ABC transporter permease protein YufQ n=1 Tax=Oceanobacillus kimchii TaxID=746691 RepID=A0ABQ5TQX1_9BACI|nr:MULTISPECIES: ABC transporter permease [Oceanobacillus]MBT2600013.1 ABC transporter permease [Oceanobacillus sp. ISL-74]MBT2652539.1 ABC transporter permease [Oceanobacillus sp. ISL-73]MCT1577076.1 ABC transporter permease [Oceanobacillus kimchii]MCT2135146.1 ABC transporter permease [Oceanobacillus kimchii]OEH56417.1 sugar ABC transporter permease [Oceanobacillus sp. E9]